MKLEHEFYRLPLLFDTDRLKQEVSAFKNIDWMPHPTGYPGNAAVPLISVNGELNDEFTGQMLPTSHLEKCPYIKQAIASFKSVFSRSRLMKLAGNCEVPEHSDINYHWYNRVRIHIPIITTPAVKFHCGGKTTHMAAGESWIFDSWKMHKVVNTGPADRIHLVIDTSGSAAFWNLLQKSQPNPEAGAPAKNNKLIPFNPNERPEINTEKYNSQLAMSPGEVDALTLDIIDDLHSAKGNDPGQSRLFEEALHQFRHDWRSLWSLYGPSKLGQAHYQLLIDNTQDIISGFKQLMLGSNNTSAAQVMRARVLVSALNPEYDTLKMPGSQLGVTHQVPMMHKHTAAEKVISRNGPCPCGSGKKYKRCHGA